MNTSSPLIAIAFPSLSPILRERAAESKARADRFGATHRLGESVQVAKNTYGYVVESDTFDMKTFAALERIGGRIIQMPAKKPLSEGAAVSDGAPADPKNVDDGKPGGTGGPAAAQAMEYGSTQSLTEGVWVRIEQHNPEDPKSGIEACQIKLEGTVPSGSQWGLLHPGEYWVFGVDQKNGVATLGKTAALSNEVYNVDLAKLEMAELPAKSEGRIPKYSIRRLQKALGLADKMRWQYAGTHPKAPAGTGDAREARIRKAEKLVMKLRLAKVRGQVKKDEAAPMATPTKQGLGGEAKAKAKAEDLGKTRTVPNPEQKTATRKETVLSTESVHSQGLQILQRMRAMNEQQIAEVQAKAKRLVEGAKPALPAPVQEKIKEFQGLTSTINEAQAAQTMGMVSMTPLAWVKQQLGQDGSEFSPAEVEQAIRAMDDEAKAAEDPEGKPSETEEKPKGSPEKSEDAAPGDFTGGLVEVLKSRGYANAEEIAKHLEAGTPPNDWFEAGGLSLQDAKRLAWEFEGRKNGTV